MGTIVRNWRIHLAGGEFWIGHGSTDRSSPAPLWNGTPQCFVGVVDPKRHVPRNNVIFVGAVALAGAFVISYGLGAEMLNFGALIAFMGVNMAAFFRYHVREGGGSPALPLLITGLVVALVLWPHQNVNLWIITGIGLAVLALWTPPLAGFTI